MKIALVTPLAPSNEGVGSVVTPLAEALSADHDVTIMSARGHMPTGSRIRHRKVWTIGRPLFLFDLTFFVFSSFVLWLSRLIESQRFDIVHYHYHGYALFSNVTTSHYCEAEGVSRLRLQPKDRPRNTLIERLTCRFWAFLEARMAGSHRTRPLIVVSARLMEEFVRHYGTPRGSINVIPNGVDCARFSPDNVTLYREEIRLQHSLTEDDLVVLTAGIDWVRKGVAQAIEALTPLKTLPVKLLVVGPDDPADYRKLAKDCGVDEMVIFPGPSLELWKYYAASDVFLLSSIYEPFGLVVLEAMATSLPVLVSDEAGAAELIQDGVNGLLLKDPQDVKEIATRLRELLVSQQRRSELGKEARRTALETTWERVAQRTVEVYRQVLEQ